MIKEAAVCAVFAFTAIAACGGGTPESTTPPPSTSASASSSAAASAAPSASAAPVDPQAKLEAQHDPFMTKCVSPMTSKEFCECRWDQFKTVFKGMDPETAKPTKEQVDDFNGKTSAACGSKLTEPPIKSNFLSSCSSNDKRLDSYCECAYGSMKKTLSLFDFIFNQTAASFDDAKKRMTEECKSKMSEPALKDIFVGACTKESGDNKTCECIWKKVRAKFSPAQIASGSADVKSVPVAECKKK